MFAQALFAKASAFVNNASQAVPALELSAPSG
jgi:hypothetical protein